MSENKNTSPAQSCENCRYACGKENLYCMEHNKRVEKSDFCFMHKERYFNSIKRTAITNG